MVDRKAVEDMKNIANILSDNPQPSLYQSQPIVKDKQMGNFLKITESFYSTAEKAVKSLSEKSKNDVNIAEALSTSRDRLGITIGEWKISIKPNGKYRKRYDVYHSESNQVIAKNLYVYEAALALVRLLNKGEVINGNKIKEVLVLEDKYATFLLESMSYNINSKKARQKNDTKRALILENRYDVVRAKADSVKEKISKLLERI